MEIIFSPRCLEYNAIGHPEGPARVRLLKDYLERLGFSVLEPEPARDEEILAVHSPELLRRIRTGDFFDPDCPVYQNLEFYVKLAVGGAILAEKVRGFSILRPPGHHAGPNFLGGFCYLNNLAVAVKLSRKKTLIVDIDGHHGNGTEAIFLGNPLVTYVSLHRMYNYPGTGHRSYANAINVPLPPRCGGERYVEALEESLEKAGRNYEELAISVGFDTYKEDPLASLGLEVDDYYSIGYVLGQLRLPTFCVLEGGYVPEIMGPAAHAFIMGLTEGGAGIGPKK